MKVKVDALKDVPASLVVFGAKNFSGQSWTCPVVIVDDNPIGVPPPDEDPVPEDGNPHPRPPEQFHHPNQNNLMVGPVAFHLLQPKQQILPVIEEAPAQDDEDEGWGHWAMPQQQHPVDVEIHAGEFLKLNDLMGPLEVHVVQPEDDHSGLTLSLGLPSANVSSAESAIGAPGIPYLDELLAPLVLPEVQPVVPVAHAAFDLNQPIEQLPLEDFAIPEVPLTAAENDNLVAESLPQPQREMPVPEPLLQHMLLPVDVAAAPFNVADEIGAPATASLIATIVPEVAVAPLIAEELTVDASKIDDLVA
ncbi:uncharacterized protein [Aegilops tauschii subsp. strangulata]